MSEREDTAKPNIWLLAGFVLLCLGNIAAGIYLFSNFAMVWSAPLSKMAGIVTALSFGMLVNLGFHKSGRSDLQKIIRLGPVLAILSFWLWSDIFDERKEYAEIRLDVSQICDQGSDRSKETQNFCRQLVAKKGGYLCDVGETPMTRCERQLRKVAGRPIATKQP